MSTKKNYAQKALSDYSTEELTRMLIDAQKKALALQTDIAQFRRNPSEAGVIEQQKIQAEYDRWNAWANKINLLLSKRAGN